MSYAVGQRVWVYNANARGRGPTEEIVTKVGRKLVTVGERRPRQFRIEDGRRNDGYGHESIRTEEQRAEADRRAAVGKVLAAARLRVEHGCPLSLDALEAIAAIVSGVSV